MRNIFCTTFVKCFDDDIIGDPIERRRGHAGVAISVNNKLQHLVELLPDGSNRVLAIRLNISKTLIIVCVYMPTRGGKSTLDDYKSILDELSEIIEKYKQIADIIIGGDMNASLHRRDLNVPQDNAFANFIQLNKLQIPETCRKQSTFYHFNQRDQSQIDYFLQSNMILHKYMTFIREFQNVSTHDSIMVTLNCSLQKSEINTRKNVNFRIRWDKIDYEQYQTNLEENLKDILVTVNSNPENNVNEIINEVSTIIVKTAEDLCPRRKQPQNKKNRDWTPEMSETIKTGKYYYWKWKQEGNRDNRESLNYKKMREQKKKLRSLQRKLTASKRDNTFTKIMELSEINDKQFFALVNRQRNVRTRNNSILKYNNKTFNTPPTILGAWTDYFEELATPAYSEKFDNKFLSIVNDDITALNEMFTKNREPVAEVTEDEVGKCILTFKNGKAPDESQVTIEHLKFGGNIIINILIKLVNIIFQNTTIPDVLKSGIGCPIFKNGGKPREDPNSYRRITIISAIGKILEKLHLAKNKLTINSKQSYLQKGFTEGEIPTIAGLIVTELNIDARERHCPLFIAITDAKKAFDIVWHKGLFREVYKMNISGDNWLIFKEWYKDVSTKVKWEGQISETFSEQQGVRQREAWSPTAYNFFYSFSFENI